jgi:hypothetical protein
MRNQMKPKITLYFCVSQQQDLGRSLLRFLDHTQLDTHTHIRTPLNEWSARRRGRYLHNKHKRKTSMQSAGFEPASQQPSGRKPKYPLHHTATGIGTGNDMLLRNWNSYADAVGGRFSYLLSGTGIYSMQSCHQHSLSRLQEPSSTLARPASSS